MDDRMSRYRRDEDGIPSTDDGTGVPTYNYVRDTRNGPECQ